MSACLLAAWHSEIVLVRPCAPFFCGCCEVLFTRGCVPPHAHMRARARSVGRLCCDDAAPQVRVRIHSAAVRKHADLCEDPDGAWRGHVRGRRVVGRRGVSCLGRAPECSSVCAA
jgi:hypothetical protein